MDLIGLYTAEDRMVKFTCPRCSKVNVFEAPLDGRIGDYETVMCTGCKQMYQGVLVKESCKCEPNMVDHPSHYQSEAGLEVIDVIEAFTFDLNGVEGFDTGNILKYICRWKNKNGLEDLKKAKWYLEHLINHVEKSEKEKINYD